MFYPRREAEVTTRQDQTIKTSRPLPRRLLRQNGTAEIRALPLAAPVSLKEVELRSRLRSYGNGSLLQTLSDTNHGADKS
jgi:hypothetical protein